MVNSIVPLVLFIGVGAYLLGNRRGGQPWAYVIVSVAISITLYFGLIAVLAFIAN